MNSISSQATKNLLRISSIIHKPSVHPCSSRNKDLFLSRSHPFIPIQFQQFSSSPDDSDAKKQKAKAKLDDLLKSLVANKDAIKKVEPSIPIKHKLAVRKPPITEPQPKKKKDKMVGKKKPDIVEAVAAPTSSPAPEVVVDPVLSTAAKGLGTTLKDPNIENELVQKLKTQQNGEKINISDLFEGMKIEQSGKTKSKDHYKEGEISESRGMTSRAHRVRNVFRDQGTDMDQLSVSESFRRQAPGRIPINLFGARPLGIFSPKTKTQPTTSILETWDKLEKKEIQLAATHPPANGFEEMILWTEQGKMWHFPIDNEQGLTEEAKVPFTEHVFLLPHIEQWCPPKGPIRHFMELVCSALSKNAHLTAPEKKEYIEWYHQYFKDKASIIKEVGAGEIK